MSHHSDINPKAYALGVLLTYYSEFFDFVYRNRYEDKKEALERFKRALDVLDCAFVDEVTFQSQLKEFSLQQTRVLALIESQRITIKRQRKEIETLKSNIK